MSVATPSHPPFPVLLFTQLARRLRNTNARYDQITYQYRRTQRPTHHAKRRAYRAGLRIDTSKALSGHGSAASLELLPVLDRAADSPVWAATEPETEDGRLPSLGLALKNLPEVVSPLELGPGLGLNVDNYDIPFQGPVPGAPRWRSKPLPEDECGVGAMTIDSVSSSSSRCTYDPAWRSVLATHASEWASAPFDAMYAGLGVAVPVRHLKRKLRELEGDGDTVCPSTTRGWRVR